LNFYLAISFRPVILRHNQFLEKTKMEVSTGYRHNNFLRRFRQKMKPSAKVYGKKDRRQNHNAQKEII